MLRDGSMVTYGPAIRTDYYAVLVVCNEFPAPELLLIHIQYVSRVDSGYEAVGLNASDPAARVLDLAGCLVNPRAHSTRNDGGNVYVL